jgi:hypothetical protein
MKHRFDSILIDVLTLENYESYLPESLAQQVAPFLPPGRTLSPSHWFF